MVSSDDSHDKCMNSSRKQHLVDVAMFTFHLSGFSAATVALALHQLYLKQWKVT